MIYDLIYNSYVAKVGLYVFDANGVWRKKELVCRRMNEGSPS